MNISTMTKDQLAAQLRDSTELLEKARMQINELAAQLEAERAKHARGGLSADENPMTCEICATSPATVFMVVRDPHRAAKAHVCIDCFEAIHARADADVESVSLQDFEAAHERGIPGFTLRSR